MLGTAERVWLLWNSQEPVGQYAERTNLPPTKILDLSNFVKLELALIPAGKFIMGTLAQTQAEYEAALVLGGTAYPVDVPATWKLSKKGDSGQLTSKK